MKQQKISSLLVLCGALGLLAGCASETKSTLVTAPPPPAPGTAPAPAQVVVVTQSQPAVATTAVAPAAANSFVVVSAPPAAPPPEAIPPRPSPENIWIPGYWTWQNNEYAWMAGHWELPPFAGAKWFNPRTVSESGNFRFYEGYWK